MPPHKLTIINNYLTPMKKVEEYIFYRTYMAYKKKDDPELFSSSMYLIGIYFSLLMPIHSSIIDLFKGIGKNYEKGMMFGCMIIRIYVIRKYYNPKNLKNILAQNRKKKKILPTWCYFTILPISIVVALYGLITSFVIKKFGLEGIILPKEILK